MEAGSKCANYTVKSDTFGLGTEEMKPNSSTLAASVFVPGAAVSAAVAATTQLTVNTTITTAVDKADGFDMAGTAQNYISKQRILSDTEVMEAVKKLTQAGCKTEARQLLESERERRQLSPASTHRLYNWNTSHFYPDVHHVDKSFRSFIAPLPNPPIMTQQLDSYVASISNESQMEEVRGLNLKIDIDLDSGSDSGEEEQSCPKKWQKSPLRVRKIRRRDGRPVSAEINYDPHTNKLYIHSLAGSDVNSVTPSKEQTITQTNIKPRMSPRKIRHPARRLSAPDKLKEFETSNNNSHISGKFGHSSTESPRQLVDPMNKTLQLHSQVDYKSQSLHATDDSHKTASQSRKVRDGQSEIKQQLEVISVDSQNKNLARSGVEGSDEVHQVNVKDLIHQFASPPSDKIKLSNSSVTNSTAAFEVEERQHGSCKIDTGRPRNVRGRRPNSSSYENIYDDILLNAQGFEAKPQHTSKSDGDRPTSNSGRYVAFDAKSLMQEEREKFKVYKMEYMRQHSSGDESSKSAKDDKSLQDESHIDIPPDEYVYVLRKLHRNKSEETNANECDNVDYKGKSEANPFLISVSRSKAEFEGGTHQVYSTRQQSQYKKNEFTHSYPNFGPAAPSVRPDLIPSPTPPLNLQNSNQFEKGSNSCPKNEMKTIDATEETKSINNEEHGRPFIFLVKKDKDVPRSDSNSLLVEQKPPKPRLAQEMPADYWQYNTGYQPTSPQESPLMNFDPTNHKDPRVALTSAQKSEVSRKPERSSCGILKSVITPPSESKTSASYTFKADKNSSRKKRLDDSNISETNGSAKISENRQNENALSGRNRDSNHTRSDNVQYLAKTVVTAARETDYSTIFSLIGYPTNKPTDASTVQPINYTSVHDDSQYGANRWYIPENLHSDQGFISGTTADEYLIPFSHAPNQHLQQQYEENLVYSEDRRNEGISSDYSDIPHRLAMDKDFGGSSEYYSKENHYRNVGAWTNINKRRPVAAWPEVELALEQDSLNRRLLKQNQTTSCQIAPEYNLRDNMAAYEYDDYAPYYVSGESDGLQVAQMSSVQATPTGQNNPESYYGYTIQPETYQDTYLEQDLNNARFCNPNVYDMHAGSIDKSHYYYHDNYSADHVVFDNEKYKVIKPTRSLKSEVYNQVDAAMSHNPKSLQQETQHRPTSLPPPSPPPPPPPAVPISLRPASKPSSRSKLKRSDTAPESVTSKSIPKLPTNEEFQRELKSVLANIQLKKIQDGESEENFTPETSFIETATKSPASLNSFKTSKVQTASSSKRTSESLLGRGRSDKSFTVQPVTSQRSLSCDRGSSDHRTSQPTKSFAEHSDEIQQSVADLKMKLFGESDFATGTSSLLNKKGKTEGPGSAFGIHISSSARHTGKSDQRGGANFDLTAGGVASSRPPPPPPSKFSHRTEDHTGQLLYDYASYRDSQKPRRSNIQDELTDFERFYESINEQISDDRATTNEPSVKRLSISNVRMLTDLQEKQTSLDYAKQWLQNSKRNGSTVPAISTTSQNDITLKNSPKPHIDSKPVTSNSMSVLASCPVARDCPQDKLPRKVFDDMAYRKWQRSGIPGKCDSDTVASSDGRSSPTVEVPKKTLVGKSVGKCEPERQIAELKLSIVPPTMKPAEPNFSRTIVGRSKENQAVRSRSLCIVKRPRDEASTTVVSSLNVRRSNSLSGTHVQPKSALSGDDDAESHPVVVSHMIELFSKSNSTPNLSDRASRKVYNKYGELVDTAEPERSRSGVEEAPDGEEMMSMTTRRQQTPREVKQRHEARGNLIVKLSSDSGYVENESDSRSSSGTDSRARNSQLTKRQFVELVEKREDSSSESTSEAELKSDGIEANSTSSVKESKAKHSGSFIIETPKERSERLLKLRQAWFEQPPTLSTGIHVKLSADVPRTKAPPVTTGNFLLSVVTDVGERKMTSTCEKSVKNSADISPESTSCASARVSAMKEIPKTMDDVSRMPPLNKPDKLSAVLQSTGSKEIPYQYEDKQYEKVWNKDTIISELRQEKFRQDKQRIDVVEEIKRNIQKPDVKCSEHLSDEVHLKKMSGINNNVTEITSQKSYRKTEEMRESDNQTVRDQNKFEATCHTPDQYATKQFSGLRNVNSNIFSEMSDGEMTDATDVTLDGMVGANRSGRPFSPETTDLSDMEQRSTAYLERLRRLPQPPRPIVRDERSFVANEKTSVIMRGGTATLLDQSSTSTQSQHISIEPPNGYLENTNLRTSSTVSGPGANSCQGPGTLHSLASMDSSQRLREVQIAQAREEMIKYRKNRPTEANSDELADQQSERRRSIKELVESFEDLTSPYLRTRPRSTEVSVDQLPNVANTGQ